MATIIQILNADRNLSLFSRGLRIAELEPALEEKGPFTILGPVNYALNRLTSLTYLDLLNPSNRNKLISFLKEYILVGKQMMETFRNDQKLETLNGTFVAIIKKQEEVFMNGAKILSRDRCGSNGVIHLLDKTYGVS